MKIKKWKRCKQFMCLTEELARPVFTKSLCFVVLMMIAQIFVMVYSTSGHMKFYESMLNYLNGSNLVFWFLGMIAGLVAICGFEFYELKQHGIYTIRGLDIPSYFLPLSCGVILAWQWMAAVIAQVLAVLVTYPFMAVSDKMMTLGGDYILEDADIYIPERIGELREVLVAHDTFYYLVPDNPYTLLYTVLGAIFIICILLFIAFWKRKCMLHGVVVGVLTIVLMVRSRTDIYDTTLTGAYWLDIAAFILAIAVLMRGIQKGGRHI